MALITLDPALVLGVLYGSPSGRRFTQDTPVLPEVWLECAKNLDGPIDGLIVPRKGHQAHHVADELHNRIMLFRKRHKGSNKEKSGVSDIPGIVSARMYFDEIVNVVLPITRWWRSNGMETLITRLGDRNIGVQIRAAFVQLRANEVEEQARLQILIPDDDDESESKSKTIPDSTIRLLMLLGMLQAIRQRQIALPLQESTSKETKTLKSLNDFSPKEIERSVVTLLKQNFLNERSNSLSKHFMDLDLIARSQYPEKSIDLKLIFTLSLNRDGAVSVHDSAKTTKADAAHKLFNITTKKVTWAIIDSGVDATHYAFRKIRSKTPVANFEPLEKEQTRVTTKYDMTLIQELRDRDKINNPEAISSLATKIMESIDDSSFPDVNIKKENIQNALEKVFSSLGEQRPLDWDLLEKLLRVNHDVIPHNHHGTHVAGILGGYWPEKTGDDSTNWVEGMCPDINIIDFNVIGSNTKITEFSVVAAQRLIRYLNERDDYLVIHGANISLSIPHDVTNYACGRTPVCEECENLVNSGVVVVVAAGNDGYNDFVTKRGIKSLHTNTSITDPGNAEAVITVGSTHRLQPHTYGVSYFSSRGPTGDGRIKPDLVAPGEKIDAPICNSDFATLEGTSMAAPHVSGAAAMLMARFPELKGDAHRIKSILCSTATDLGRERIYQGCGLVDILRALQSV